MCDLPQSPLLLKQSLNPIIIIIRYQFYLQIREFDLKSEVALRPYHFHLYLALRNLNYARFFSSFPVL